MRLAASISAAISRAAMDRFQSEPVEGFSVAQSGPELLHDALEIEPGVEVVELSGVVVTASVLEVGALFDLGALEGAVESLDITMIVLGVHYQPGDHRLPL